jgi:hypothetical protein
MIYTYDGMTLNDVGGSSELLRFWTSSIVQYSKKLENTTLRKLDVSVLR